MHSMSSHRCDPRTNQLLAALPDGAWNRWRPHLQAMDLRCGLELGRAGAPPDHAIFPATAVVSLMCMTHDGATSEICVVGNDGVVGIPLINGGTGAPALPVVQSAGLAYRLDPQLVTDEIRRGGEVLSILLRYGQAVLAQVAQTALCNRHHTIEQQVCRRLLLGLDRSTSGELAMTHARIALGLGVRREGVSAAALRLQQAGVIRYRRGRIVVLDRRRLEAQACECYRAVMHQCAPPLPAAGRHAHRPQLWSVSDRGRRVPAACAVAAGP